MKLELTRFLSKCFRASPHFKGKYRIGSTLQKLFLGSNYIPELGNEIVKLKNGSILIIDPNGLTYRPSYWTGIYDYYYINKFCNLLSKDSVVLDIGANIGFYTIPFAKHLQKIGGKIYSFEPIKRNFDILSKNVKLNNVHDSICLSQIALGNENKIIQMSFTEESKCGNACITVEQLSKSGYLPNDTAQMKRMDDIFDQQKIDRCDFIKIDVEGAEIFFVQGAQKFLEKTRPIIWSECNAFFLKNYNYDILDIWKILKDLDYICFVDISRGHRGIFKECELKSGMSDILFVPRQKVPSLRDAKLIAC